MSFDCSASPLCFTEVPNSNTEATCCRHRCSWAAPGIVGVLPCCQRRFGSPADGGPAPEWTPETEPVSGQCNWTQQPLLTSCQRWGYGKEDAAGKKESVALSRQITQIWIPTWCCSNFCSHFSRAGVIFLLHMSACWKQSQCISDFGWMSSFRGKCKQNPSALLGRGGRFKGLEPNHCKPNALVHTKTVSELRWSCFSIQTLLIVGQLVALCCPAMMWCSVIES